jgi:hypothetical protein
VRVVDTCLLIYACEDVAAGDVTERVALVQDVTRQSVMALYNDKLVSEYQAHYKRLASNDLFVLFISSLTDAGRRKSSLSRQEDQVARSCRWESHDDHLLAASVSDKGSEICTTETKHCSRGGCVLRKFGVHVKCVAPRR